MDTPIAVELVRLDELVHTLRQRCPWDREQTHGTLARHLLEESYEVLEAIDEMAAVDSSASDPGLAEELAVAHLEEELGDLLFQVYFHALLGAEAGRFTLADVARGVHDKLGRRAIPMCSATGPPIDPRTWRPTGRPSRKRRRTARA